MPSAEPVEVTVPVPVMIRGLSAGASTTGPLIWLKIMRGIGPLRCPSLWRLAQIRSDVSNRRHCRRQSTRLGDESTFAAHQPVGQSPTPPGDGALQALAQIDFNAPTGRGREALAVRQQGANLRTWRAHARWIVFDRSFVAIGETYHRLNDVPDSCRGSAAGVVGAAKFNIRRDSNSREGFDGVSDESEIAHRRGVAHEDCRARRIERLADDHGDHGAFALTRAKRVERSQNGDRKVE